MLSKEDLILLSGALCREVVKPCGEESEREQEHKLYEISALGCMIFEKFARKRKFMILCCGINH